MCALRLLRSPPPAGKHGLNGGQIAGIIIGVLLALALVAAAGLLLARRQKRVCCARQHHHMAAMLLCSPPACVQALQDIASVRLLQFAATVASNMPSYTEKVSLPLSSLCASALTL